MLLWLPCPQAHGTLLHAGGMHVEVRYSYLIFRLVSSVHANRYPRVDNCTTLAITISYGWLTDGLFLCLSSHFLSLFSLSLAGTLFMHMLKFSIRSGPILCTALCRWTTPPIPILPPSRVPRPRRWHPSHLSPSTMHSPCLTNMKWLLLGQCITSKSLHTLMITSKKRKKKNGVFFHFVFHECNLRNVWFFWRCSAAYSEFISSILFFQSQGS